MTYIYDGEDVIAEYDGQGQLARKFVHGPGIDNPILMDTGTEQYYYHTNDLGSVIALTDSAAAVVETYRYTAYGQPEPPSAVGNPYLYTARRYDSEISLYYYRARYYDPHLRRFIQPDPIGYLGGMNLYAYVGNSPVSFVDPWGLANINLHNQYTDIMLYNWAEKWNPAGYYSVSGHGTPSYMKDASGNKLTPADLAKMILKDPRLSWPDDLPQFVRNWQGG